MMKIKKILVPTDFSTESLKALRYAKEFVGTLLGAEILVVHVMEPPVSPTMTMAVSANVPIIYDQLRAACSARLESLVAEELPREIPSRTVLREGRPWSELTELAAEEAVDLIIIATNGRTGIKHFMLGSTAERVVRVAPCAVLTVRDHQRDFVRD